MPLVKVSFSISFGKLCNLDVYKYDSYGELTSSVSLSDDSEVKVFRNVMRELGPETSALLFSKIFDSIDLSVENELAYYSVTFEKDVPVTSRIGV